MSVKKTLLPIMLACVMVFTLVACGGGGSSAPTSAVPAPSETASAAPSATDTGEKPYIGVVSKGFQHQFWQVVKKGAEQAAVDYNVDINFVGPPSESDVQIQVDMLKSELDKNPAAICLAALDTESVQEQLMTCKEKGIPVVGFDSGVPNAPDGSVYATASTDNNAAGALAAQNLFENEDFKAALEAATVDAPIYVGVVSQDATSESITGRTAGFIDELASLAGEATTEVKGHDKFNKAATEGANLVITVVVSAKTDADSVKTAAESLLTGANKLTAIYGSNEAGIGGILAASNDGNDFADGGKYGDIIAIGFDAGKTQKVAVQNGWLYGSITQDPFQIGYKAVELAVKAIDGEAAPNPPIVDTGAKWYNKDNVGDPDINELVYE